MVYGWYMLCLYIIIVAHSFSFCGVEQKDDDSVTSSRNPTVNNVRQ